MDRQFSKGVDLAKLIATLPDEIADLKPLRRIGDNGPKVV